MKKVAMHIRIILLSLTFFYLTLAKLAAQSDRQIQETFSMTCGTFPTKPSHHHQRLPAQAPGNLRVSQNVYKIPAVVHVISSTQCPPLSNVRYRDYPTDELIMAEVNEASLRFRQNHPQANSYTNPLYGVDTEIELVLARVDPHGKFTSGINRIVDPMAEGRSYSSMKAILNKYRWDTTKYCNIFIVKGMTDASGLYEPEGDFTVYNTTSFWSGLMNHEIGHFLGLLHIFQTDDGYSCPNNNDCLSSGDQICDTPPKNSAGDPSEACGKNVTINSCSTDEADISINNPYRSVSLGGMGDQPDMLSNYMDYTGRCWDAYTLGQKNRMRENMIWRSDMRVFSETAFNLPLPENYVHVRNLNLVANACLGTYTPIIEIMNQGASTITSLNLGLLKNLILEEQLVWTGTLLPGVSQSISLPEIKLSEGSYTFKAYITSTDQSITSVYQTGMCREMHVDDSKQDLFIPFAICTDAELGTISNDKDLNWSAFKFGRWYAGSDCRQCVAALSRKEATDYPAQKAIFELASRDFTSFDHPMLTFKLGYIPVYKSGPYDTLQVKVAAPCKPFETLWGKTALDLATNNPQAYSTGEYGNYPRCEEYIDITIDLEKYAGENSVRIQFLGQGKFTGPLFIDDIQVFNKKLMGTLHVASPNRLSVVDPVEDKLIIITEEKFLSFQVLSITGNLLFEGDNKEIDVSRLNAGMYLLAARNNNYRVIQKFIKN